MDRFILCQPDWLSKVNELYTEENLEALKAYMLKGTLEPLGAFLDQECLSLYNEYTSAIAGTEVTETVEDMVYTYTNSCWIWPWEKCMPRHMFLPRQRRMWRI